MRSGKVIYTWLLGLVLWFPVFSQSPGNIWFFPVRPGEKNYLAGTMGEIRATHFHTGIDIKTSGITGLKVYAAKSGYVSRIRVGPAGYGNCLYIIDKDGITAVYGHLLRFRDDIQEYTIQEQYRKQTFEINIFPPRDKFPVTIGDVIALSGNSGSTTGPHLHFELRDPDMNIINPLKYAGFSEIKDDIPPNVLAFSIKSLDIHSRVNDQFGNFVFMPARTDNVFHYNEPIRVYGLIGIEVQAYDRLNGAANRDGIPYIKMMLDGKTVMDMDLTKFSIPQAGNTPVFYDNQLRSSARRTFQKIFIDDGNNLPFYTNSINKGKILIRDTLMHELLLSFEDINGNQSFLKIQLQGAVPVVKHKNHLLLPDQPVSYSIMDNTLMITNREKEESPENAVIYSNRRSFEMIPAYTYAGLSVFLWDLRQGLPDSVRIGQNAANFDFKVTIPSGTDFTYYDPYYELKTYPRSLYDTLYLTSSYTLDDRKREVFRIGESDFPLDGSVRIRFLPRIKYDTTRQYGVYSTDNFRNFNFEGNAWSDNSVTIHTSNLGNFIILRDSLPPQITPLRLSENMVSFRVRDDLSGIKDFTATIGGQWLLMYYDPKKDLIWSMRRDENIPLKGEFNLEVTDNCGNKAVYNTKI